MKTRFDRYLNILHNKQPVEPPPPLTFSTTQPLPNATLDLRSLLRELLEGRLKPTVLRKL